MTEDLTPRQLAIRRRELAVDFRDNCVRIGEIKQAKAFEIIKIRADVKSDAQAERIWETTDMGQEELKLTYKNKGLIELIRSLKTEIDIKNNEAFGTY